MNIECRLLAVYLRQLATGNFFYFDGKGEDKPGYYHILDSEYNPTEFLCTPYEFKHTLLDVANSIVLPSATIVGVLAFTELPEQLVPRLEQKQVYSLPPFNE